MAPIAAFLVVIAGLTQVGCRHTSEIQRQPKSDHASPQSAPSTDSELDELRRLANRAPLHELFGKRHDFLDRLIQDYPRDQRAWHGVARITTRVLADPHVPHRRMFARWLAQVIEKAHPSVRAPLLAHTNALRAVE